MNIETSKGPRGSRVRNEEARKMLSGLRASDLAEIEALPGLGCHPLKGQRRGQFAVTLHDRWRLIFSLQGRQVKVVRIEEVTKHYGD